MICPATTAEAKGIKMQANIKSLTTVRLTGAGNNGNWAVRARLRNGQPLYLGHGANYTLHQAQAVMQANRYDLSGWVSLPAGVVVAAV